MANNLWNFNFLSDLHLIIVLYLNLEVGWGDTPGNATSDFIKGLKRGDTYSEIASKEEYFVDFVKTRIVLWVVVDYLGHRYEYRWIYKEWKERGWEENNKKIINESEKKYKKEK